MTNNVDPKQFGKVGVLMGGRSAERDISFMSGNGVLAALRSKGIDAHAFDPALSTLAQLADAKFERVFIALHGRHGEDGTIQGVLEQLGIAYTGPGVMASAIALDKITTKRIWQSENLPTPRFHILDIQRSSASELQQAPQQLGLPLMLKAPHEGSTIGIVKVESDAAMAAALQVCAQYDTRVLAEEFISGRELTVAILQSAGNGRARALPIVEICAPGGNYDYQNKYFSDDTRYIVPAVLNDALTQRIQRMAERAFDVIGCRGWARVDLMLRAADDEPFLLEINTSPGMTGHSLVPMAAKAEGISYADLCVEILAAASLDWIAPSVDGAGA